MSGLAVDVTVDRGGFALDLAIDVAPGTTTALMGPNGAGKSTALAAIAGLVRPSRGRIVIGGRPVDDVEAGVHLDPARRRVGVVFQDLLLFPGLTVLDNVAFAGRMRTRSRRRARADAAAWVARFGLTELADRYPAQLSGGQAQRVALARALAAEPEVLLLDEPMAALDVRVREQSRRELVAHLTEYAGATLLITHDFGDARAIAGRGVVLEQGRITQAGALAELEATPASEYVARLVRGG
ncbi:sulfate/molybdate ABC transporter ATP-binding protein [Protaetiibacter mangrovi]